ncbi:MAG: hypothetical protein ACI8UO_006727 [Verrucomicrobiales bacterium]|jgi:hypothetical protein
MKRKPIIISIIVIATLIAGLAYATGRQRYETADYKVVETNGAFEIRAYRALAVASTKMDNENSGFGRLFKYIAGQNQTESKIAMTTPVFVSSDSKEKETMSFVLPYETAEAGAPEPKGASVFLNKLRGGKFAVYRYAGRSSESRDTKALTKLQEWIVESGMEVKTASTPRFAYYDPPWTPGPFRRNEVMIEIR